MYSESSNRGKIKKFNVIHYVFVSLFSTEMHKIILVKWRAAGKHIRRNERWMCGWEQRLATKKNTQKWKQSVGFIQPTGSSKPQHTHIHVCKTNTKVTESVFTFRRVCVKVVPHAFCSGVMKGQTGFRFHTRERFTASVCDRQLYLLSDASGSRFRLYFDKTPVAIATRDIYIFNLFFNSCYPTTDVTL